MLDAAQRNKHMNTLAAIPPMMAAGQEPTPAETANIVQAAMALVFNFMENIEIIAQAQHAMATHADKAAADRAEALHSGIRPDATA